jgi:uncharacterized RDD family membrane protein YckC
MTNPNEPGSGSEDSAGQQPSYQPPPPPQGGYQPPPPPQGGYQPPPPPQGGYQPPPPPQGGYQPQPGQGFGAPQGYGGMPQQPQGGGMGGPKLAEMPIRLVARIIDGVLVGIVFSIVYFALFVSLAAGTNATYDPNTGVYNAGSAGMSFFLIFVLEILVYGVLTFGYEVTMIALRGATVGKQLMGVMVVLESNGQIPGWTPSIKRWLVPWAASFVCGIGALVVYISPFFDNGKRFQGWHDKFAETLVISTK